MTAITYARSLFSRKLRTFRKTTRRTRHTRRIRIRAFSSSPEHATDRLRVVARRLRGATLIAYNGLQSRTRVVITNRVRYYLQHVNVMFATTSTVTIVLLIWMTCSYCSAATRVSIRQSSGHADIPNTSPFKTYSFRLHFVGLPPRSIGIRFPVCGTTRITVEQYLNNKFKKIVWS